MSGLPAPPEAGPLGKDAGGCREGQQRRTEGDSSGRRRRHSSNGVANGTGQSGSTACSLSASSSSSSSSLRAPPLKDGHSHRNAGTSVASQGVTSGSQGDSSALLAPSPDNGEAPPGPVELGAPGSLGFRVVFLDEARRVISPWHDLPLFMPPDEPGADLCSTGSTVGSGADSGTGADSGALWTEDRTHGVRTANTSSSGPDESKKGSGAGKGRSGGSKGSSGGGRAGAAPGSAGQGRRGESGGGGAPWVSAVCTTPRGSRLKHEPAFEPFTPLRVSIKRGENGTAARDEVGMAPPQTPHCPPKPEAA